MKAVGLTRYLPIDDPLSLIDIELPKPVASGRDLLVAVRAVSLNPVDTKARRVRRDKPGPPTILGFDASGVVEAVGPGATLFKPGDEVFYAGDLTRPGSNAQFQLVDERITGRKPRTLSFAEAAALPLTAITAYEVLHDRLGLDRAGKDAGRSIFIIGGAGGVGSIAIQLAKLAKLLVVTTASRPQSAEWVRKLGADHVIDHRQDMRPQLEALGLHQVDTVAVFNDPDSHWNTAIDLVAPQGTIALIVDNQRPLSNLEAKRKSIRIAWESMFTRSMFQTPDMIEQHNMLNTVSKLIDDGVLRSTANTAMHPINAENLRKAHRAIEQGDTIGKITLEGWEQ
jgi:NADPH2:quinone reductase